MKTRIAAVALAAAAFASPAMADETTFCNAFITTLPYTINVQGHYCFNRNLSTAITTGNAITINADYVLLDLNNFKLGGGSAGPTTQAIGIYAEDHSNITIRNGNIRGFHTAIRVWDSSVTAANVTIENNVLDGNIVQAVYSDLDNITVRNNQILETGVGGVGTFAYAVTFGDNPWVVEDNFISGIYADTARVVGGGYTYSYGVLDHNTIAAYSADAGAGICRDNNVLGSATFSCYRNWGNLEF
jgi:hypothetical protein